ncbi:nuclear transport factor 2 family protein [Dankookia rubra]|uniref:Nuclear transport factor 2 family protein n=1 Tax=Dankookia rubra TaxID=1442381 RepID=A0A4R5QJ98_9PROT|nr:nuclear transport factor 2 family protein [Dankookia rubra]TDH63133.1 nuclear transport factor 2 family protein [Dankookia rubra]
MSTNDPTVPGAPEPDFGHLLRANLERVFNERDPARRAAAMEDLYVADPVMYEPTAVVTGRAAIAEVAGRLLEQFGPGFAFHADGVAVGHHGLGTLRWHAGPGEEVAVTGTDAAQVVDGRISRLWVLLDPAVR